MPTLRDDLGHPVSLTRPPRRIVSLVPSLTEALAVTVPDRLGGGPHRGPPPAGPRRPPGPRPQEPRPCRDRRAGPGPCHRQPRGEPPARRRAAAGGGDPGVGHRDRDGGRSPALAPPPVHRRPVRARTRMDTLCRR